jgi:cation:H+ antiporter
MTLTLVLALAGLVLLVAGGEALVRGASRLALALGLSPLVIGLTVVAYGTSAPEMAVSVGAALAGDGGADVAVGNVVGSNIFNVLFILGVTALFAPLLVSQQLVRIDVPLLIGVSLVMLVFALDGRVSRLEGFVLVAGAVAYTVFAVWQSRRESAEVREEYSKGIRRPARPGWRATSVDLLLIVGGLVLLVVGSRWLVDGAVAVAMALGVSELVVGLTIVAAGTSLPEVAASVVAALRGERDIAVGNVVGSSLFNILSVLGVTSLVAPGGVRVADAALRFDIPVMVVTAVACLPIFTSGRRIDRWEGGLFLAYYVAYATYLVLDATGHDALPAFSAAMLWFVVPLTAVTLAVVGWRDWRGVRS